MTWERMLLVPGRHVREEDLMIAFRKLHSPTVIKAVWWMTVILAALFLIISEYFGIRLWSIALGFGQESPAITETPPASTEGPFHEEPFPSDPASDPLGLESAFDQLATLAGQFILGLAIAVVVLPPVIAVSWVLWTRLILEALALHFRVEDNTRRTPRVDQTQPTS
jgi:hypothetical protein